MKEPAFYTQKADEIISKINEVVKDSYSSKLSLDQLVSETELLFFGYSENYPSLLDIKLLKEQYRGWYFDHGNTVSERLLMLLSLFKAFVLNRQ